MCRHFTNIEQHATMTRMIFFGSYDASSVHVIVVTVGIFFFFFFFFEVNQLHGLTKQPRIHFMKKIH